MNILIPMAGEGSRFKINGYELPKPLIEVDGEPMIKRAVETLNLDGQYIFVTRKYQNEENNKLLNKTLKEIAPNCIIHQIDYLTEGASATCLTVKDKIDNDKPLIITNCDQLMEWDSKSFLDSITDADGIVVTYDSKDPKNSFIKLDENGNGEVLTEKDPISNLALIGLHYWKNGKDFVRSAESMIKSEMKSKNEYYIAPTYNILIGEGKKIKNYHLSKGQYIPVGTPEDLNVYIGKKREFKLDKPRTIICDLDGTILKHAHKYSKLNKVAPELNDGVREKFDEWDSLGYKIILMTGRKESGRRLTEEHLEQLGIPYDMLIMGAGNGQRVLINDKLTEDHFDRAIAVNVVSDTGWEKTDWKDYYL